MEKDLAALSIKEVEAMDMEEVGRLSSTLKLTRKAIVGKPDDEQNDDDDDDKYIEGVPACASSG